MEIVLPKYGEGLDFSKVTKRLLGKNVIPIGRHHDNTMLCTIVYEVE